MSVENQLCRLKRSRHMDDLPCGRQREMVASIGEDKDLK